MIRTAPPQAGQFFNIDSEHPFPGLCTCHRGAAFSPSERRLQVPTQKRRDCRPPKKSFC
jgi:hypothetical protein